MRKRILAMLLAVTMCTELLAGCGTAAVAAAPGASVAVEKSSAGTEEYLQDITAFTEGGTTKPQAQLNAAPAYYYTVPGSVHTGSYYIYGCVRSSEPTDIIGEIINKLPYESLEGRVKPTLWGATVTLVDKTGQPCLDVNGKEQKTSTNYKGEFHLKVDANAQPVKVLKGEEAYKTTHYIKIEKEGYRPIVEEVAVISKEDFKKETERYLLEEVLPQAQELLDNTREGVEPLYLEGEQQASDKAKYHVEYSLDKLEAGREEIRAGAEQLLTLKTEEGQKAFWDEAQDLSHRSWGEWFEEMGDKIPRRWKLYVSSIALHMYGAHGYVPGVAESQAAERAEIAREIEELHATTSIWEDAEFWNFGAAIVKEIGIWIGLSYATAGLGQWARMYGFFTKGARAYALTGEASRAGAALKQMRGGNLYLTEEQATAANRMIATLTQTDEGKLIWEQVEKGLAMRRNVHPAELKEMLLKALDDKIAAEAEKANAIRAVGEERVNALNDAIAMQKRLEDEIHEHYGKISREVPDEIYETLDHLSEDTETEVIRKIRESILDHELLGISETDLLGVRIENLKQRGDWELYRANKMNGQALAYILNQYEKRAIKKISISGENEIIFRGYDIYDDVHFPIIGKIEGKGKLKTVEDYLAFGMESLGAVVAEQRIYGSHSEMILVHWLDARQCFKQAVKKQLNANDSVLLHVEGQISFLADELLFEYYTRMNKAYATMEGTGVFPILAETLADFGTIDWQAYRRVAERIIEDKGLKNLCGNQWFTSVILDDMIAMEEKLYMAEQRCRLIKENLESEGWFCVKI